MPKPTLQSVFCHHVVQTVTYHGNLASNTLSQEYWGIENQKTIASSDTFEISLKARGTQEKSSTFRDLSLS